MLLILVQNMVILKVDLGLNSKEVESMKEKPVSRGETLKLQLLMLKIRGHSSSTEEMSSQQY